MAVGVAVRVIVGTDVLVGGTGVLVDGTAVDVGEKVAVGTGVGCWLHTAGFIGSSSPCARRPGRSVVRRISHLPLDGS